MAAPPTRLVALLVAVPFALGACGSTPKDSAKSFKGDQRAVAQTVEDLQSAASKGDQKKICGQLLADSLVAQIRTSSKKSCDDAIQDAIRDVDAFELQVQKVTVNGDAATATVKSEAGKDHTASTLTFVREHAAWKIATLGTSQS